MNEYEYKGHRIRVRQGRGLSAAMFQPGSPRAMRETPEATTKEGIEVLLERAKAMIDARIDEEAPSDPGSTDA